jgi:hypothetical protein
MKAILPLLLAPVLNAPAADKPVFLYSRHYNAAGETRYLPDGTYSEVLKRLRGDFDVRVHAEPMGEDALADVGVLLISNPSEKAVGTNPPPALVSDADIEVLVNFVERGGGLIIMGNQENHNLETEQVNRLLARFGMKFVDRYTDVKAFDLPATTPAIGGLRWGYYTGNLVALEADHPANPHALVMNDSRPPLNGARNAPGALLAAARHGRGRVIVATDAGWISNSVLAGRGIAGVVIERDDNWEIFHRLSLWAAGR